MIIQDCCVCDSLNREHLKYVWNINLNEPIAREYIHSRKKKPQKLKLFDFYSRNVKICNKWLLSSILLDGCSNL